MNATDMDTEAAFRNDHETIAGEDPFAMFGEWLELAHRKEINDANAMALATADPDGLPNVRMVLLKGFDREGFVFYTNTESQKGVELAENMQAAAVLHWKSLRRQVRFRGTVNRVSAEEADAYFVSRARASRIGAWASKQSRPLEKPHGPGQVCRDRSGAIRDQRHTAPRVLDGVPNRTELHRVLDGQAVPPA